MRQFHELTLKSYFDKFISNVNNSLAETHEEEGAMIECTGEFHQSKNGEFHQSTSGKKSETKREPLSNIIDESTTDSSSSCLSSIKEESAFDVDNLTSVSEASQEEEPFSVSSTNLPWYCGMLYECKLCQNQFLEMPELKKHLNIYHETSLDEVICTHGDPTVANNIHECLVCGKGIPHCHTSIRGHLNVHDLSPNLYYEQNKDEIDAEQVVLPITDPTLLDKLSRRRISLPRVTPPNVARPNDTNDSTTKSVSEWLSRCTYACKICDFETNLYATFFTHINKLHQISGKAYMEQHGTKLRTIVVSHTCQLCGLILHWDRCSIVKHLKRAHNSTTLHDYVQMYKNTYTDFPSLPETENDKWMNQCVFDCKECKKPEQFTTRSKLILHLFQEHKLFVKEYADKHGSIFSNLVFLPCKICDKSMRWDKDSITAHLDRFHSMSPENYVKEQYEGDSESILALVKQLSTKRKSLDPTQEKEPIVHLANSSTSMNDWLNKCKFECKLCNKYVTSNQSTFVTHLTKTHKTSVKEYMDQNEGKLWTTMIHHTCQLCGFILVWDRSLISRHLLRQHNSVTLAEYVNEYEKNYEEFPDFVETDSDQWMNQCEFECRECEIPQHFKTRNKLILHLFKEHQLTIKDYLEKNSNPISRLENLTCKICDKTIRWDSDTISAHLDKSHQLTPESYICDILKGDLTTLLATLKKSSTERINRKISPSTENLSANAISDWLNRCRFLCRFCNYEASNYSSFANHLKSHKISGKEYVEQNGGKMCSSLVSHTCQLCGYIVDWDRSTIAKHFQIKHNSISLQEYVETYANTYTDFPTLDEHEDDQWMNQCAFECKECREPKIFNTRNKLILHLYKDHNLTIKEYTEKEKSLISTLVNHICKICDKMMRWDSDSIAAHLDRFHSTTPQNYFKDFLKSDGIDSFLPAATKQNSGKQISDVNATASLKIHWSDKCSFACQICFQVVQSKDSLKWHLQTEHKMKEQYYNDHFAGEGGIVQKVLHSCLICGDELLFDSQVIKKHLQISHNKMPIDLYKADYFDKFSPDKDSRLLNNDWLFKSKYSCKTCSLVITGKDQLKKHLLDEHGAKEKQGSSLYEEHHHICQVEDEKGNVCAKEVLWDGRLMRYHLGKHNLTAEQYRAKYMDDQNGLTLKNIRNEKWTNKCTFLCVVCNKTFATKSSLSSHMENDHSTAISRPLPDLTVHYLLHTCQICSENLLWEEETLANHFAAKHDLDVSEYAKQHLPNYEENEDCSREIYKFESWMNRCVFQCKLCPPGEMATVNKKTKLYTHLAKSHADNRRGYFAEYEEETFVEKVDHVCQLCAQSVLWDGSYLQRHIEHTHKIASAVYRAKYMSDYTDNVDEIELRREEENKLARAAARSNGEATSTCLDESETSSSMIITLNDSDDDDVTGEIRTWARGCLYKCEICESEVAGARSFENHLATSHEMSLSSYKKKYVNNQSCVITGFHFCRICSNNVRHDEADLKNHFAKEHKITVSNYFEQFKGKLKMPRLARPAATRTTVNSCELNSPLKRVRQEEKITEKPIKKRRSNETKN